jgi:hypothetical protein
MEEILKAINLVLASWSEEEAVERGIDYFQALEDEWVEYMERNYYQGWEDTEW